MDNTRKETDSLGDVLVPANRYYGAQTARAIANFPIGIELMPEEIIRALALVKKAAAMANRDLGCLSKEKAGYILQAAEEILAGQFLDEFPLPVWQTGSGTQTNMNVNEVIANRANELAGSQRGSKTPVHPNDDVNMSQSSNDVFPTAMHIAAALMLDRALLPALFKLKDALAEKAVAFEGNVKIGRTHLMDAVPMTLGQEISAFVQQINNGIDRLNGVLPRLNQLALGGTAVGTGLNAPVGFAEKTIKHLGEFTGLPFILAENPFEALATNDTLVELSSALKTLAVSLMKVANDIRWLASGPRCGLGEINLPANEPGSSIMPGKVNPTQCEALIMVCAQVLGNDVTVTVAGANGNFQLNVYKPVIIYNVLQSLRLLSDAAISFADRCVAGITVNEETLKINRERSLMLVTALSRHIGYDQAAKIAQKAYQDKITLKEAGVSLGFVSAADYDKWVRPQDMAYPS